MIDDNEDRNIREKEKFEMLKKFYKIETEMKRLFTIGYTKKNAERFFDIINAAGVKKVIDVRLYNNSQLAGFAKKENLKYFLRELCDCDYFYLPAMAPSKDLFDDFKKKSIDWDEYESRFKKLIVQRKMVQMISPHYIDGVCLLCCEPEATNCHRRLVAEHYQNTFKDIYICHL